MTGYLKQAFLKGAEAALRQYKIAAAITSTTVTAPKLNTSTNSMGNLSLSPPMASSPMTGAATAAPGGKAFNPIPATPGVKLPS